MDLDDARNGVGRTVIYSPFAEPDIDDETGVITSVSDRYAFVAYGGQQQAKATNPGDLRFADEPRSGAMTLCAAHSVRSGPRSPADLEEWKACPDCVKTPWEPADGS